MLQAQFEENEQSVTGRVAFWSIGEQLPLTPSPVRQAGQHRCEIIIKNGWM